MKSILFVLTLIYITNAAVTDLSPTKDTWTSPSCNFGTCETHGTETVLRSAHAKSFGGSYTDFVTWTAWDLSSLSGSTVVSAFARYTIGCMSGSESCVSLNSRATCEGNNHTAHNTTNGWGQNTLTNSNCIGLSCPNLPANIATIGTGTVSGGLLSIDVTQAVKDRQGLTLSMNVFETDTGLSSYYSVFCSQNAASNKPILRVTTV